MSVPQRFLPWFRRGAGTLIHTQTSPAGHYHTEARVAVVGAQTTTATVPIHFYGPGDVVGLDKTQILRRDPVPNSGSAEPNYFPMLELREADLPWRYSPISAVNDRLQPWLTLITLEYRPDLEVRSRGTAPLPAIAAPLSELPNLAEAALWTHVQISGTAETTPDGLRQYVQQNPHQAIARLLCPRRLKPLTDYLICLVPTFESGRLAGLGEAFDPKLIQLQPAWTFNAQSRETHLLPVYDFWRFKTAATGDFEGLARSLKPYTQPANATAQTFTIDPILAGTPPTPLTLPFEGALRPVQMRTPMPVPSPVRDRLKHWLNQAAAVSEAGGDPVVTPPLYGAWQANQTRVEAAGSPLWFNELNLDPRYRIAAAAGGDIVQRYQEEFVQAVWQQTGQLQQANSLLRGAQVAEVVSDRLIQRHLQPLPEGMVLEIAGAQQNRLRSGAGTLFSIFSTSAISPATLDGSFRRVARVRGPLMRRWSGGLGLGEAPLLLQQGFINHQPANLPVEIVDEGTVEAPSRWVLSDFRNLSQTSNIHAPPYEREALDKRGTMYLLGESHLKDYRFLVGLRSSDDDAIGFVFRYRDRNNFYRFSMDRERQYRRLVKCVNGVFFILWEDSFIYELNVFYFCELLVEGNQMRLLFNRQKLFELTDDSHAQGRMGCYCWGSAGASFEQIHCELQMGLGRSDLQARVVDEGTVNAPSRWTTESGWLVQTSNIYTEPRDRDLLPKLGTYLKLGNPAWSDYAVSLTLQSTDDDDIGLMFRHHDAQNYYRFSMDLERSYQRLVKCVNGQFSLLWQRDEGFETGQTYGLEIIVNGTQLRGYLNGRPLFNLRDDRHRTGAIACYSWGVTGAKFGQLVVRNLSQETFLTRINRQQQTGQLPLNTLKQSVLTGLEAQKTVRDRTFERVRFAPRTASFATASTIPAEVKPLQWSPDLPQPLVTRLAEQAPHLLLPGLATIPDASVLLVEPNPAFIASFLVGANHEMTRELLWRGLDTDLRATIFRQFWDVRGGLHTNQTAAAQEAHKDIAPIHTWSATEPLVSHGRSLNAPRSIILIRSEFVRRFPEARYALVEGRILGRQRTPGTTTALPLFRGQLTDDIAYFAFAIAPDAARGNPGWYFMIEQPMTNTRFGLDPFTPETTLPNWSNLAWNHFTDSPYLSLADLLISPPAHPLTWGKNAAHTAAITLQKPVRLFIHMQRLIA